MNDRRAGRAPGVALATAVALVILSAAAAGSARGDDVAAAEALFQNARRLMKQGKFREACPKLEESLRLDAGTGTLWHLGRCYEKTGRLASAWAKYHELAALARRGREPAKVRAALRAARQIEPKLHKLVIEVPEESRLEGLQVLRDGTEIGPGAWGTEVPVDRGEHRVRARAPGYQGWSSEVTIEGPASVTTIEVPPLEEEPEPSGAVPEPGEIEGGGGRSAGGSEAPLPRDVGPWYGDGLGWTLAIGGAVLAAGGGVSLVRSSSLADEADRQMDLAERDRLLDDAEVYQVAGGTLLAVGGAALAAGVVKLALHPKDAETREAGTQAWIQVGSGATLIGVAGDF